VQLYSIHVEAAKATEHEPKKTQKRFGDKRDRRAHVQHAREKEMDEKSAEGCKTLDGIRTQKASPIDYPMRRRWARSSRLSWLSVRISSICALKWSIPGLYPRALTHTFMSSSCLYHSKPLRLALSGGPDSLYFNTVIGWKRSSSHYSERDSGSRGRKILA
jgi:hypothetical protein